MGLFMLNNSPIGSEEFFKQVVEALGFLDYYRIYKYVGIAKAFR
jgi:hypothetical protein